LKLKNASYLAHKYTSPSTSVGGGTPVTITHNLNNTNPVVSIKQDSTGALITLAVNNFTANTFDVTKNGANINVTVEAQG
jgi:NAD kinase